MQSVSNHSITPRWSSFIVPIANWEVACILAWWAGRRARTYDFGGVYTRSDNLQPDFCVLLNDLRR